MTDPADRGAHTGRANARELARGRKWADKWARWPAHTEQDRLDDFAAAEAADENEKWKHS